MDVLSPKVPKEVVHDLVLPQDYFPNNSQYPLLIYKQVLDYPNPEAVKRLLKENHWINSWANSIYDYHHYHSNTHETLVIIAGHCKVQMGGPKGAVYDVAQGDVIILPAGVAHKNVRSSSDFECIGSYPINDDYDMNYGTAEEHPQVDRNIEQVALPNSDPVFGTQGLLFNYWK